MSMRKLIKRNVKARFNWFTGRAEGIAYELASPVQLSAATGKEHIDVKIDDNSRTWRALWDTGSTTSLISPQIIEEEELNPIGVLNVAVAGGIQCVNSFYVDIKLPNSVTIANMILGCIELPNNVDLLIGMDIITLGDFAITNVGGRTVISFRIPSLVNIDFGRKESSFIVPPLFITPDQPCPCGSGNKYGECCMNQENNKEESPN